MAVRCKHARELGAYSSRRPRNQRYTLDHDLMLLVRWQIHGWRRNESIRFRRDARRLQVIHRHTAAFKDTDAELNSNNRGRIAG
jgi:hypothetical protein